MTETITVQMQLPKLPPGKRYTGEFRVLKPEEQYVDGGGSIETWRASGPSECWYLIVEDEWQPPEFLAPGWMFAIVPHEWYWSAIKPVLIGDTWVKANNDCVRLRCIRDELLPPFTTAENAIYEIKPQ